MTGGGLRRSDDTTWFRDLYTRDVAKKMAFYGRAFGMQKGRLADKEVYGEMLGGDVKLQFVQEEFARRYVPDFLPNRLERPAAGVEIGFLFDDVAAAYHRAIDAGCTSVAAPEKRPWGRSPSCVMMREYSLR
jgi:lactoylglutathione lyase